jgi:hypothetical protein
MNCQEALAQCGLFVRRDGRVARVSAADLMPLLNAKIDGLMRLVKAYEAKIADQQGEISRLRVELEDIRRGV